MISGLSGLHIFGFTLKPPCKLHFQIPRDYWILRWLKSAVMIGEDTMI